MAYLRDVTRKQTQARRGQSKAVTSLTGPPQEPEAGVGASPAIARATRAWPPGCCRIGSNLKPWYPALHASEKGRAALRPAELGVAGLLAKCNGRRSRHVQQGDRMAMTAGERTPGRVSRAKIQIEPTEMSKLTDHDESEVLTFNSLLALLGRRSRQSIYDLMKRDPSFPRPRQIGSEFSVGWLRGEVTEWLKSRPPVELNGLDAVERRRRASGSRPASARLAKPA